jgi:peptidoglycan/xylan/chitin deacetylase (PgdA/CDA1 family)
MRPVPVMSFHSVGHAGLPYDMRHLTTSPQLLERILRWLKRHDFTSLSQQQLFDHLAHGAKVPSKSVVLAFDDGYLDNWVYVHPLLKKYGLCGVIYVTGDFVDGETAVRPTVEDVWAGKLSTEDLPGLGYCSWAELRLMAAAGTLEVQSHLMTHSWLPVSDEIVGSHDEDHPRYWLGWNASPADKPGWLSWSRAELDCRVPLGTPVYRHARSHVQPRCWPDAKPPRYESRVAFENRFHLECQEARRLIETHIPGARANFMAWPGGEYDSRLQELALQHYDATFTTDHGVTLAGEDPTLIKRSFFAQRSPELMGWAYPSYLNFVGRLQCLRGRSLYKLHTFMSRRAILWFGRRGGGSV